MGGANPPETGYQKKNHRQKSAVVGPTVRIYSVRERTRYSRARMNNTLNSKTARVGDIFTATVTEPVYSNNGVMVIPSGSTLTGRVDFRAGVTKRRQTRHD